MAEFDPISYSKANKVAAQLAEKANQADLTALGTRVDTIITTPVDGVSAQEIIDARQGAATLGAKLAEKANQADLDSNGLKLAKVEKDLNDYQQTMSGININQEPTQQATGYGMVSLPKNAANGQISDVRVLGNTVFWNQLINKAHYRPTTIFNGITYTNNGDGSWSVSGTATARSNLVTSATHSIPVVKGNKYLLRGCPLGGSSNTYCVVAVHYNDVTYQGISTEVGNGLVFTPVNDSVNYIRIEIVGANLAGQTVTNLKFVPQLFDLTQMFGAGNEPATVAEFTAQFPDTYYPYNAGSVKSTVSAMRLRSVSEDETEESTQYITAKDEEGNTVELRSLPNGTKDEIRVSENKLIKRIGDKTNVASGTVIDYSDMTTGGQFVAYASDGTSQVGVKGDTLTITATSLTYQLATPIEKPIQVSGSLVSYPSGTVYIEPFVADAGIYVDKMEVLYSDLPIKALEKISKVDFGTGLETELDITATVIAEDKLSFTHPDLTSGDIVFYVYEHGAEGTIPETEISYYDSRYVIKGEDDKFYQWEIEAKLVGGVITPSIKLVEV
jgi:hypothetical protein